MALQETLPSAGRFLFSLDKSLSWTSPLDSSTLDSPLDSPAPLDSPLDSVPVGLARAV
jgi:hypothetical protein